MTFNAQLGRDKSSGACMVGLLPAASNEQLASLLQRLSRQEFQFSDFVAGFADTGEVIAFDVNFRPFQKL
jgi:hypothetical protein